MQLLNILLATWLLKGIWDLTIGLVTIVVGLLELLRAYLDLGFYFLKRAPRFLWKSAFPRKSPAPSGQGLGLPGTLALENRAMSGHKQPATAHATSGKDARSSQNPPVEVHGHTKSTHTNPTDLADEKFYQEACQDWLHNLPPAELPLIINLAVSQFRNGLISKEEARKTLDRFRSMLIEWKKNNSLIQQMMNKIPDEA